MSTPVPVVTTTALLINEAAWPVSRSSVQAAISYLQTVRGAAQGTGSSMSVTRQVEGLQALLANVPALFQYGHELEAGLRTVAVRLDSITSPRSVELLLGLQAAYDVSTQPTAPTITPVTPAVPASSDGSPTPPTLTTPAAPAVIGNLLPLVAWQRGWEAGRAYAYSEGYVAGWTGGRTSGWNAGWPAGWLAGWVKGARAIMDDVLARIAAKLGG